MRTRIFTFFLIVFNLVFFYSQNSGISYQALIINPRGEKVPGYNNLSAPLVNKEICMRFSIIDQNNQAEYVETIKTTTDKAGIVNLIIGSGNKIGGYANTFNTIIWDRNPKKLKVEFNADGVCSNYIEISNQHFSYVPFSYYSSSTKEATAQNTGSVRLSGDLAGLGSTATSPKISEGAITTTKLSDGAVINSKIGEIITVNNGGTGTANIIGYVIANGNNPMTAVASIPVRDVSGAQSINNLESAINTSSDPENKYPSVKAVKDYISNSLAGSSIVDADATTKGKIQLAGDLGGTAAAPTVPGLALKANSSDVTASLATKENTANKSTDVTLSSNSDVKFPTEKAVKTYVDTQVASATIADADATTKGKIQLAGDLTGTAANPTITNSAIVTSKLADGAVTDVKIASGINPSKVGLGNVDNTSDANKPVSIPQQTALNLKEDLSNKSVNVSTDGTSDQKYPSVKAVKSYVDNAIATNATPDADAITKGKVQLAGDLTGTAANPTIANSAITTAKLADDAVTTVKIKDGNVTTAKINDSAITTSKIDDDAVTTAKIKDGNVTTSKINDNAIITSKIDDDAVTTVKIKDGNVTTLKINDNAIISSKIADDAVTTVKIKDGNVTTNKIADASITNAKLAEPISISNGGTGSSTQNFVDLTTDQNIAGVKTFDSDIIANGVKVGKGSGNGDSNVAVGTDLGTGTGYRNTGVGAGALQNFSGTSFGNNTGIGFGNMQGLTTGYGNTSVGGETLANVGNNDNNTAIGNQTLRNADSSNNTALGANAGNGVTTGSGNTLLGSQADIGTGTNSNATAIGYGAVVNGDNTIQLGNNDITSVKTKGKLTTGNITYPNTSGSNGQFLKTDGNGNASWSNLPDINTSNIIDGAVTDAKIASGISASKVGLGNVDNTSDADKPISTLQQAALDLKEDESNKSTDIIADGNSDSKYPSVKAIKDYVDTLNAAAGVADGSITSAKITDGTIVNADVSSTAAIAYSKLNLAGSITTADIVDGAVTTAKVNDGAISTAKLADGSVNSTKITDGTITNADVSTTAAIAYSKLNLAGSIATSDIVDGAITDDKIANGISASKVGLGSVDNTSDADKPVSTAQQAALDLKENLSNKSTNITTDANSTTKYPSVKLIKDYVDSAIASATIADADANTKGKIQLAGDLTGSAGAPTVASGAINTSKLADGSVNSAKITDGTIVNADVSTTAAIAYSKLNLAGSISTADIVDGAVTTAKVNDGAITSAKITDGTIVNADVSTTAAIAYSKLNLAGSIATADIVDGAVTTAKVNDGAISTAKLADGSVNSTKITDGTITNADVSTTAAIAYSKINLAGSIATTDIVDGAVTNVKIADGTIDLTTKVTGTLPINRGGTGASTKAAAFDALSPMSASGDIIYGGTNGTGTRLAKGTDGQILTLASGVPSWTSPFISSIGAISSTSTANGVSVTSGVLSLAAADGTNGGVVTTGSQTFAGAKTFSNNLLITSTTASSSTSTGALTVSGGVGIAGAINAGSIQNTPIGSTTPSTGAFTTLSTTGNSTLGGTLAVSGATTINGNTSVSGTNTLTVGTGATTLGGSLTVAGATTLNGSLTIPTGAATGEVLISDANGVASWSYSPGAVVVRNTNTAYTIGLGDSYIFYTGNGNVTFTIPAAASTNAGKEITIKNKTASTITINTASGTIYVDSANTAVSSVSVGIEASNNWVKLVSDGTQWNVLRALF